MPLCVGNEFQRFSELQLEHSGGVGGKSEEPTGYEGCSRTKVLTMCPAVQSAVSGGVAGTQIEPVRLLHSARFHFSDAARNAAALDCASEKASLVIPCACTRSSMDKDSMSFAFISPRT